MWYVEPLLKTCNAGDRAFPDAIIVNLLMQTQSKLDDVRDITPIDTLVHMGAGRCIELEEYLTLQPRQLLLVEADSQLAEDLQNRIENVTQAQVSCVAIAGNPGQATLYRYNLPEVNSLHPASGLMDLFPGLKLVEQQQVEAVSPVTLLKPLQLQAEKENRLVIDLPGEELPVLEALQQSQQLELFSLVYLYCGREPLYEGSEPATRILEWLKAEGFDMVVEDDSPDPDRPCWSFRRNALHLRYRGLQQQVEKLTQDRDGQAKLANDRQSQLDQVSKTRDEQAKVVVDLQAQIEKLTQDRDSQIDNLSKQVEQQAKQITDKQAQMEYAQRALQEKDAQIAESTQRQRLLDDEIIKAEAQIDLIKDVLLREPGI